MTQEFEAEKIVNFAYIKGILMYQVKWAGYDNPGDYTWEPYSHLENCQDLIQSYFQSLNIPKPPDIDPRINQTSPKRNTKNNEKSETEGNQSDDKNPSQNSTNSSVITVENGENQVYPYVFLRRPKREISSRNYFSCVEGTDYGPSFKPPNYEIERIARKDGKLFVVIRKITELTYIPFETAVMLFPDVLQEYLKSKNQQ